MMPFAILSPRRLFSLGWILVALSRASVSAAEPEPRAPEAQLPSAGQEVVLVNLVQIEILATDGEGRPVTDLKAEEVVVKEHGRTQKIAIFQPHFASTPPSETPRGRIVFAGPDGPETVTGVGREGRRFVLFFDLVHIDPRARIPLLEGAKRFVDERMEPADRAAVAWFDGQLHLERPFSENKEVVSAAVESVLARPATAVRFDARMRELLASLRTCQTEMAASRGFGAGRDCFAAQARTYIREANDSTLAFIQALDDLIRLLAGVDGRKYVMMFSHGVALDPALDAIEAARSIAGTNQQIEDLRFELSSETDYRGALYGALERAVASKVTLFTLDGTPHPTDDTGARNAQLSRRGAQPMTVAFDNARDGLEEIARSTGGLFYGSASYDLNLAAATDATRGGYLLGYYSDRVTVDPADPAKVSVKCTRRGVQLTARSWRLRPQATQTRALGGLAVDAARTDGAIHRVPFRVTLRPEAFDPARGPDLVAIAPTVHVLLRTASGNLVADTFQFISHVYTLKEWSLGKGSDIVLGGYLEVPEGDYLLQLRIRDPRGDRNYEASQPIHIAPEKEAAPGS